MADRIKLGLAVVLVLAGIGGYYYWSSAPAIVRVLAVFAGIGLGLAVAALSEPGRQFIAFSREAITEARKVVWPTRKETLQATGAVFFLVITMALFLWLVDAGLLWIVKTLMGQSG